MLATTNIASPMATNSFDAGGDFNFTNAIDPNLLWQFYLLQIP
ncbi:MAG TPA: hypothetical protein VKJ65_04795 [Phycisphaerae bacterium]|nr:hypothetical protein [Phycisphaerae bacterium]